MIHREDIRNKRGATLGLTLACLILLTIVGVAFVYLIQIISGDHQVTSATDAGALAAAQQIPIVTLTPAQVTLLPAEFLGLGVDKNGVVCPSGTDSNGNPALFNETAYNNCAVYTIEICLNAADDGSQTAINNANQLIAAINQFATDLDNNLQISPNLATAASNLMDSNPHNNLPKPLFGQGTTTTLVPGSLQFGYYVSADPTTGNATSNDFFPVAFSSKDQKIANWVTQFLSNTPSPNNGPNFISAAKPFDLNQITGSSGFIGKIALIPSKSLAPQLTHLVSPNVGSNFYLTLPGMSGLTLPHNALQLKGQSNASTNGANATNNNGGTPISVGTNQNSQLNLIALSAAVTSSAGPYQANIPSGSSSSGSGSSGSGSSGSGSSGATSSTTGAPAYVAIINGGDFQASLNSAGLGANFLQSQGYSNVNLTPNTNIAYDGSQGDIFDVLDYEMELESYVTKGWIFIGTDSSTGLFDQYQAQGLENWIPQVTYIQQKFPTTNYSDVLDNPGLASKSPSVPFVFLADYLKYSAQNPNGVLTSTIGTPITGSAFSHDIALVNCMADFSAWINYNRSHGSDGLGHDANLDPLRSLGGSPLMYKKNPNYVVPNTLISATSGFGQTMTIADALKIVDISVFHDGWAVFDSTQPAWVDNIMPVIASNYGLDYLPIPVGETKPNGFTAIEYAKAQIICLHAGFGLLENPITPPSNPGIIYLPGPQNNSSNQITNTNYPGASNVYSGLRYFQPYDTNGNRAHYVWPEPANCPKFETPGTPMQLLNNINVLNNGGKFNPADHNYDVLLNDLLVVVQQINSSVDLNQLIAALDSAPIDLGQTFYLIYDSTQKKLVMVSNLPDGLTYQKGDGAQALATYSTNYPISGGTADLADTNKTLIDTGVAANSTISYQGQNVITAPYGDSEMHRAPYNSTNPCDSKGNWSLTNPMTVNALDTATFWPSSGANNNHGELHLSETVGGSFMSLAIN